MYRKHPRHVTQEQFADATTVDGSRIDTAMDQLVERHNNVPASDIRTRYTANTYYSGWIPAVATDNPVVPPPDPGHHFPWMPVFNSPGESVGADIPDMSNPQRIKGYEIPGINSSGVGAQFAQQFAFTTCYSFTEPVIIKRLFVQLGIDNLADPALARVNFPPLVPLGDYPGPLVPEPFSLGDPSQDFVVVLEASSPFSPEDRQHDDVEITRNQFAFSKDLFRSVRWPDQGSFDDMFPETWPGCGPAGFMIPLEVDIPIHEAARVRLSLVIPPIAGSPLGTQYTSSWGTEPFNVCHWATTLVVLERLTS